MKVYYLQAEYQPAKHRIVTVNYNADDFKFDPITLSPYLILTIDEVAPVNQSLCFDLVKTVGRVNINGEGKYYIDNLGVLMQVAGWTEYSPVRV